MRNGDIVTVVLVTADSVSVQKSDVGGVFYVPHSRVEVPNPSREEKLCVDMRLPRGEIFARIHLIAIEGPES